MSSITQRVERLERQMRAPSQGVDYEVLHGELTARIVAAVHAGKMKQSLALELLELDDPDDRRDPDPR